MNKFKMSKSKDSNIPVTVRFNPDLYDKIKGIVDRANQGKEVKEYSYNGFIVSACEYALENMEE